MLNQKVLVVMIIPLLLIPLASFAYAHYTYTIEKKYKIHVYCGEVDIETYKIYSPLDDKYVDDQLINNTLSFSADVWLGWYVWVGFLVKNNGLYAMNYEGTDIQIQTIPPDSVTWQINEFYYGPMTKGEFNHNPDVWRSITGDNYEEKLDPNTGIIGLESERAYTPIYLEPDGDHNLNKLIVWIYMETLTGPETFTVEISINTSTTIAESYEVEQHEVIS